MPRKEKNAVPKVGGERSGRVSKRIASSTMENPQVPTTIDDATTETSQETLECRSFWKAGENFSFPLVATPTSPPGMIEHARVHPKFLHSNATSHKWAFGAIAELLDNAVNEIQNGATFVKIDKIHLDKGNSPALVFLDNGGGMDPDGMRKCMTIGQYGNGFMSSTMRLGADALVFSRSTRSGKSTQTIGFLSYTYHMNTGQDDIIVPVIDMSNYWPPVLHGSLEDWAANFNIILKWSPFSTHDQLLHQFEDIGEHGTKIIVYNLWHNDEGNYELIFDDDHEDICLEDESVRGKKRKNKKQSELRSHISYRLRFSLRAYVSMLYMRKFENFKIILRGIPVEQYIIADEIVYPQTIMYRPHKDMPSTEVKLGFVNEEPNLSVSGFNIYHKNRLILPFWKVNSKRSIADRGVVGVFEANFIEPGHDKQDFDRSSNLFQLLVSKLKLILSNYWNSNCFGSLITPIDKSERIPKLDQPQTDDANNPSPLPCDQSSQAGPSHLTDSTDDTGDNLAGMSAHEIREENLKLFIRGEEARMKEKELEETINKLQKELAECKSKNAQATLLVEATKKEIQQGSKMIIKTERSP